MKFLLSALTASLVVTATPVFAQRVIANLPAGEGPAAIAINPVTNRIYVASRGSASVTVIDGATQQLLSGPDGLPGGAIAVGLKPSAIAVNPRTNRIYVANEGSNTVSVINGDTHEVTHVGVGLAPRAIAVDEAREQVYVANGGGASVTALDGVSHATRTIQVGNAPVAVVVHPDTGRVYTVNQESNSVTVIDAGTHVVATVATGQLPARIALHPVAHQIYVLNGDGDWVSTIGTITVIDGATLETGILPAALRSSALAVDTARNRILLLTPNTGYFAFSSGSLDVLDPAARTRLTVPVGESAADVLLNSSSRTIFVANRGFDGSAGSVTAIDAETLVATHIATGERPERLALNPLTNVVYVASPLTGRVVVIEGRPPVSPMASVLSFSRR